ncbi:MAG: hypothetical protein LAT51_13490 [Flavobacteriaceae bacterium]|nr:hypothetical protein [Flavobacteriaceae bacterium]
MNTFKNIAKTVVNIFSKQFYFLANLTSIIALIIIFVNQKWAVVFALAFFCLMLFVFTCYLLYSIYRIIEVRDIEHENKSTFVKYETNDGNIIIFETYKLIQCKKPLLTQLEYKFNWTGTHMPTITSNLQNLKNIVDEKDNTKYDKAILKFKKPLYYNQNTVVHFRAELDDTDKVSQPHVETRVAEEVDIIHYRIILKHKADTFDKNAILKRAKINSTVSPKFEKLREIAYDKITKSYEYHLLKPEIGYFYRISWE